MSGGKHRGAGRSGRSGSHTAWGLSLRQFRADPLSLSLAVLIACVSLLLTLVPRGLEDVQHRQIDEDVARMSARQRDVSGVWNTTVDSLKAKDSSGAYNDQWAPVLKGAERVREAQPEPLRSVLLEPEAASRINRRFEHTPPEATGFFAAELTVISDPALLEYADLVSGSWPRPDVSDVGADPGDRPGSDRVEVVILDDAAQRLQARVGDPLADQFVLAGTYRPKNADDPHWQYLDNGTRMSVREDSSRGQQAAATVFISGLNRGSLGGPSATQGRVWFPIDREMLASGAVDPSLVRQQLTGFLAQRHVLVARGDALLGPVEGDQSPAFTTELTDTLDLILRQQAATSSLLAVVAAGPLGVALAVLVLTARLVIQRRRTALAVVLARGADPRQVRTLVGLEGLLLGIPAALLGHLGARLLLPGPARWWEWLVTGIAAIVPAVVLMTSLGNASLLTRRSDLTGRSSSRWRWVAEFGVVALAGVALWQLLQRPQRADEAGTGIDLLASAAPVLLAFAACLIALRVYPLPLAVITRLLRRRRPLTSFLGAARAVRDPAGGLVPAAAVVLGTSLALVSAVLLATVTRGAEAAAWEKNGGAVRITGAVMDEKTLGELRAVDGVAAIAPIHFHNNPQELFVGGKRSLVTIFAAGPELVEVLGPGHPSGIPDLLHRRDGAMTVLTGGQGVPESGRGTMTASRESVDVLGRLPRLPGVPTPVSWALVDAERWTAMGKTLPTARMALLSVSPDADPHAVARAISELRPDSVVTTVAEELDAFTTGPVTEGLRRAFLAATTFSGLLTVLSIVLVQIMGAASRTRLLAVLRTLGLPPRGARGLTAWELGPLLVVSLLVGGVMGVGIAWLIVRSVELRGLTGGVEQPPVQIDPLVVGGVIAAVLVTVGLAVSISAWLSGRSDLAQTLRVGEER